MCLMLIQHLLECHQTLFHFVGGGWGQEYTCGAAVHEIYTCVMHASHPCVDMLQSFLRCDAMLQGATCPYVTISFVDHFIAWLCCPLLLYHRSSNCLTGPNYINSPAVPLDHPTAPSHPPFYSSPTLLLHPPTLSLSTPHLLK